MPDQTIEPAIARPRGLPGLSRRDDRTAWLTAVTGDLRIAALAYVARQAATACTSRTRDAGLVDIRAILANPETSFEEFARFIGAHAATRRSWGALPFGLSRDDLGERAEWFARLLRSAIPHVPTAPWIRQATMDELAKSPALIRAAWPDLSPREWAPLLPAAEEVKAEDVLVGLVIDHLGLQAFRAGQRWFPWPVGGHSVPPSVSRNEAVTALEAALAWPDDSLLAITAGVRAALVERAIAGHAPRDVLSLLTVEDRIEVARHATACPDHRYLDELLATTPLPVELIEPHSTCARPRHQQALLVNPWVPTPVAVKAIRHAVTALAAGPKSGEDVGAWVTLPAILAGRGWLPRDEVALAVAEIADAALRVAEAPEHPGMRHAYAGGWGGRDIVDTIAMALARGIDMPSLPEPGRTRAIAVLRSQGTRVSTMLIMQLPHDAQLACALAVEQSTNIKAIADPCFSSVIVELDEQTRVIAARHGRGALLRALASDPSIRVRQHVARNSRAPRDTLITLASDPEEKVSSQIARNRQIDEALLVQLAGNGGAGAAAATRVLLRRLA